MHSPTMRLALTANLAVVCLGATAAVATAPQADAATTTISINEVYGGGGNSGATYRSDFVELVNRSSSPIDLTGWSIKYWSAGGTSAQTTPLTGTVAAGAHYLVKEADGANTSATELPTADATGKIAMSATAGRVAVVDASGATVDLLGWGSASTYEGAPASATNNTVSVARSNPCTDTDNNAADFVTGAPTPENSSAAAITCTGTTPPPPAGVAATVEQVQGNTHLSPLKGQLVHDVTGVVTATNRNGFWMQQVDDLDSDPATSQGVYVFTRTAPSVTVGDKVSVAATVTEYRAGGTSGLSNLTTTELSNPTVTVTSHGNALPAPVVIGVDRTAPQQTVYAGDPGNVEKVGALEPEVNALDFDESMEGMRVALQDARAVGPTNTSYGETPVVPGQNVSAIESPRGGVVYGGYDHPNSMRLILDDSLGADVPVADVGDHYTGQTVGVLDYSYANFHLLVTQPAPLASAGLQREVTKAADDAQLSVGTFNVENLAPSDQPLKYQRLAGQIVHNLQAPAILAIEEIQDNSGAADDGVTDSTTTVNKLIAAIKAAGGPSYAARWVNPNNDTDGGQPGGNIRQVFLYRTDVDLKFVAKGTAGPDVATDVTGSGRNTSLTVSPGRIDPTNSAWANSRKPLVGEFTWHGRSLFVVANHFNSKGGDDPLMGRWQQPVRNSEIQRHQQATLVRGFVDRLLKADASANVVVLGDLNDFEFSKTADILVGSGSTALTDLPRTLPASERYTYVYEGNSQVLDHILISPNLTTSKSKGLPAYEYDIVHTNSEFHDQDSDHDPQVVLLSNGATR